MGRRLTTTLLCVAGLTGCAGLRSGSVASSGAAPAVDVAEIGPQRRGVQYPIRRGSQPPNVVVARTDDPPTSVKEETPDRHARLVLAGAEREKDEPSHDVVQASGDQRLLLDAPLAETHVAPPEPTVDGPTPPPGVEPPPVVMGPEYHDLDLTTALSLVGGRSPQVAIAHERLCEAYADWRAAKALWLPSIGAGFSVNRHTGTLQASNGLVADVDRTSLQAGLGAGAVGAGTVPRPGVVARFHTADAWFQPLIAERAATARRHAEAAEVNDQLLAAALAYLDLLEAEQLVAVARETLVNTEELVRVTTAFADSGEGNRADADRAETELSLRRNELARAEEAVAVASARLAEVLSLDAGLRMRPLEPALVPIDLVVPGGDLRSLVAQGLGQRPELRESAALVDEACRRLQREKSAPLVPSLLLGASVSGFGGGPGGRVDNFRDRVDVDALVTWEVRNLGYGERAARDRARATVRRTRAERVRAMDRVAREIAVGHARVTARSSQIAIAEEGVAKAEASYRRNVDRIRDGQGLPIEVLQSMQALDAARRDYVRTIADYNESQFQLHRAIGWPIRV